MLFSMDNLQSEGQDSQKVGSKVIGRAVARFFEIERRGAKANEMF